MTPILSNGYAVNFEGHAYAALKTYLSDTAHSKTFVLVDQHTEAYCLPVFIDRMGAVINPEIIRIQAGEEYKNLDTCTEVWEALTKLGADRKSLLINLGGGVITDLGGLVAATFKRGIAFINIPTTLLSMVDASVGGKTGVDLGVLKNQIGLFANPEMVLIDPQYLETLPEKELRSGLAEIIKYGLSYDVTLWDEVNSFKELSISNIKKLIHRSIEIKNEVVTTDPREAGLRKVLNYGHTLGHAIESYFLASSDKEKLTHGAAIAVGMITEAYLSHKVLGFPMDQVAFIKEKLLAIYPKIAITSVDYQEILALLVHDKKNVDGQVNFVLLSAYATFTLDCKVETSLLSAALDYYIA
ncbi:MAG: 3-dehydroquinate synthase [Lutibacter sp.]|nr:3-dehydroquinate synthase [Lutibacter sp.]